MKYGKLENEQIIYYTPYKGGLQLNEYIIYNPTKEQFLQAGYYPIKEVPEDGVDIIENNTLLHYIGFEQGKQNAINKKLEEIDAYDISSDVNGFYINNMSMWIPRETRVSLQNSTAILLKNNIETTTLWEGTIRFDIPCILLLQMLDALEIYALHCFNVTAEHKANILNMDSIDDINSYDYTIGYPEKLVFNL